MSLFPTPRAKGSNAGPAAWGPPLALPRTSAASATLHPCTYSVEAAVRVSGVKRTPKRHANGSHVCWLQVPEQAAGSNSMRDHKSCQQNEHPYPPSDTGCSVPGEREKKGKLSPAWCTKADHSRRRERDEMSFQQHTTRGVHPHCSSSTCAPLPCLKQEHLLSSRVISPTSKIV